MSLVAELRRVDLYRGKTVVLRGVDLELHAGEILGVAGPSGAGKSTLLRLLAGLERPTRGAVRVAARRVGYVFQEHRLLPWDTVLDNVALPLMAAGTTRREARARARGMLGRMRLGDAAEAYPRELSGGMNQRVSLARALACEPDLLLLDEPFTGLDPALRETMRALLREGLDGGRAAVVHVTHALEELLPGTRQLLTLEPSPTGSVCTRAPFPGA